MVLVVLVITVFVVHVMVEWSVIIVMVLVTDVIMDDRGQILVIFVMRQGRHLGG